ncbi:sugar MFS transporter [Asticcacaulis sp. EMRT-3]|uniref:sugar MFS transporter n=1 Tax=Asticcacaulis sp. EMRT-3 TaxID=3040349 RepID=UPI0024AFFB76|nr:sugar MFS transporter [Asticcacaulis sp. EMRT-3]MDI7775290.1 sugar MFS transporter [Asticcacaulis sp. EMRT-3]
MSDSATAPQAKSGGGGLILAVLYVTALFFIWAFVTNLVDPLVKSMMVIYHLSNLEAQLNQFAFFIAYGVMSIPSAWYLAKYGYANSIILGLIGIIAGCLIAFSTAYSHTFVTVLVGLFVAASGITLLQVAANPLIAAMGKPQGSHFRLNLSQAFNSMGAYIGGSFGAVFLLKGPLFEKDVVPTQAMKDAGLHFVTNVYLEIAVVFAVFTLAVFLVRNTIAAHSPKKALHVESPFKAFSSKWANLGSLGIFLYVGAEVCVISGMIFFLEQPQILNVPSQIAGYVGPIFMLMAMFGRFIGSWLMTFIKATTMLTIVALGAAILCLVVIFTFHMPATPLGGTVNVFGYQTALTMGFVPGIAAILIGLFNSIMFPTIFTLTLERSSAPASATSGLMCMAICGGGFISLLYGWAVDQFLAHFPVGARSLAFVVPLICYLYVLWFTLAAKKAPVHAIEEDIASAH